MTVTAEDRWARRTILYGEKGESALLALQIAKVALAERDELADDVLRLNDEVRRMTLDDEPEWELRAPWLPVTPW